MSLMDRNRLIEQIAPTAFDPTFRNSNLPRTFKRSSDGPDLQGPKRSRNLCAIFAIPIEDQEPGR